MFQSLGGQREGVTHPCGCLLFNVAFNLTVDSFMPRLTSVKILS